MFIPVLFIFTTVADRMEQLRSAMLEILGNMISKDDYFSIFLFNGEVKKSWTDKHGELARKGIFKGSLTTKVKKFINGLKTGGLTNINDALLEGIKMAEQSKTEAELMDKSLAEMVVFLTDGTATKGERNPEEIVKNVQTRNSQQIPILTLAFGLDADLTLLQGISAQTDSLSRMIFDGLDAKDQLENFFHQVERPTLSRVQFEYLGNVKQDSLSKVTEGQMFSGGEHVTMGELASNSSDLGLDVVVSADSKDGAVATRTTLMEENASSENL